jgi:hypothetical protein
MHSKPRNDDWLDAPRPMPELRRYTGEERRAQPRRKRSAIIDGQRVDGMQPLFERIIGVLILLVSFAGTMALFNGGWSDWQINAIIAGAGVQALCTSVQWMYRTNWRNVWYLIFLALDIGTSVAGYHAIVGTSIARMLANVGVPGVDIAAWGLMIAIAAVVAVVPEKILID